MILFAQLALGAGIGAATPLVASLTGDLFPAARAGPGLRAHPVRRVPRRRRRAPAGRADGRLVELARVVLGAGRARADPGDRVAAAAARAGPRRIRPWCRHRPDRAHDRHRRRRPSPAWSHDAGIQPTRAAVLHDDPATKSLRWAIRYVLSIKTNVLLIAASALAYYYVAGLQAFVVVYLRGRYDLGQGIATTMLVFVGVGGGGRHPDHRTAVRPAVARGRIASRPVIGGIACLFAAAFWAVPGLTWRPFAIVLPDPAVRRRRDRRRQPAAGRGPAGHHALPAVGAGGERAHVHPDPVQVVRPVAVRLPVGPVRARPAPTPTGCRAAARKGSPGR